MRALLNHPSTALSAVTSLSTALVAKPPPRTPSRRPRFATASTPPKRTVLPPTTPRARRARARRRRRSEDVGLAAAAILERGVKRLVAGALSGAAWGAPRRRAKVSRPTRLCSGNSGWNGGGHLFQAGGTRSARAPSAWRLAQSGEVPISLPSTTTELARAERRGRRRRRHRVRRVRAHAFADFGRLAHLHGDVAVRAQKRGRGAFGLRRGRRARGLGGRHRRDFRVIRGWGFVQPQAGPHGGEAACSPALPPPR